MTAPTHFLSIAGHLFLFFAFTPPDFETPLRVSPPRQTDNVFRFFSCARLPEPPEVLVVMISRSRRFELDLSSFPRGSARCSKAVFLLSRARPDEPRLPRCGFHSVVFRVLKKEAETIRPPFMCGMWRFSSYSLFCFLRRL